MRADEHRLILDAGHGEYMPPQVPDVEVRIVFSPFDEDLPTGHYLEDNERAAIALAAALHAVDVERFEPYDATWCTVISMRGSLKGLDLAFEGLLAEVSACPSGDDDTFDYWPSGARLLQALASDLDEIDRDTNRAIRAAEAINGVLAELGPEIAAELRPKL